MDQACAELISDNSSDEDRPHGEDSDDIMPDVDMQPEEGMHDLWAQFHERYMDEDGPYIQQEKGTRRK